MQRDQGCVSPFDLRDSSHHETVTFQLHHAVNNMNKTIRFILAVSAEHQEL